MTLAVHPIRREGNLARLDYTITVTSDEDWEPDGDLGPAPGDAGYASVWDTELIDHTNEKVYLTATDSQGNCDCTDLSQDVTIVAHNPTNFYNDYADPPSDVHSIDVRFPIFGVVENVPVQ